MTRLLLAATTTFALLAASAATAQTPKTPVRSAAPAAVATKTPTPSLAAAGANTTGHSAAAVDCSKQADAKGLHGKARDRFRSSCKAAAKRG